MQQFHSFCPLILQVVCLDDMFDSKNHQAPFFAPPTIRKKRSSEEFRSLASPASPISSKSMAPRESFTCFFAEKNYKFGAWKDHQQKHLQWTQ